MVLLDLQDFWLVSEFVWWILVGKLCYRVFLDLKVKEVFPELQEIP